ncbi:hypothetical protein HGRIS_009765 [Hohenbuehelia grisea]|uniref:F-box domain-containing protein n=1 Tax=Hohenbuehelia grisea TaxID=104357 RepID=A0ABR3J2N1_9AGAR
METLKKQMLLLQSKRAYHTSRIKYYKGMVTLARRLPPEILASIFWLCANNFSSNAPLTYSQVCTEWRRAALTPYLWSRPVVDCAERTACSQARLWLKRAAETSLSITLYIYHQATSPDEVIKIFLPKSSNWHSLKICGTSSDVHRVLELCTLPMPQLRRFAAECPRQVTLDPTPLHIALTSATKLDACSLSSVTIPTVDLFPTSITRLCLSILPIAPFDISMTNLMMLLGNLGHLQTLDLRLPRDTSAQPLIWDTVEPEALDLSYLLQLKLDGHYDAYRLLRFIRTPMLQSFSLSYGEGLEPLNLPPATEEILSHFLQTNCDTLQKLELSSITTFPSNYGTWLGCMPGLREIYLHDSDIPDAAMHLLSEAPLLCPRLARLDLRWCENLRGQSLVDLVRVRTLARKDNPMSDDAPSTIEEVTLINCASVLVKDVIELATMTICRVLAPQDEDRCSQSLCSVIYVLRVYYFGEYRE